MFLVPKTISFGKKVRKFLGKIVEEPVRSKSESANMVAVKDTVSMIEKAEAKTNRHTKKGFPIKTVNAAQQSDAPGLVQQNYRATG